MLLLLLLLWLLLLLLLWLLFVVFGWLLVLLFIVPLLDAADVDVTAAVFGFTVTEAAVGAAGAAILLLFFKLIFVRMVLLPFWLLPFNVVFKFFFDEFVLVFSLCPLTNDAIKSLVVDVSLLFTTVELIEWIFCILNELIVHIVLGSDQFFMSLRFLCSVIDSAVAGSHERHIEMVRAIYNWITAIPF